MNIKPTPNVKVAQQSTMLHGFRPHGAEAKKPTSNETGHTKSVQRNVSNILSKEAKMEWNYSNVRNLFINDALPVR